MPRFPEENPVDETRDLAKFLEGVGAYTAIAGDKANAEKFTRAAYWLEKTSRRVCAGGIIGCHGGRDCTSDHK